MMPSQPHSRQASTLQPCRWGLLLLGSLLLVGCSIVEKTLDMEQRLFVRIPVGIQGGGRLAEAGQVWAFKHVVEAPANSDGVPQNWYYAWRKDGMKLKLNTLLPQWGRVEQLSVQVARDAHAVFGVYPVLIEPALVYHEKPKSTLQSPEQVGAPTTGTVVLNKLPVKVWSYGKTEDGRVDPLWHLDEKHTQLSAARAEVSPLMQKADPEKRVRLGILDSGFDSSHPTWPKHITDEPAGNALSALFMPETQITRTAAAAPGSSYGSHGTGALSLLAARPVQAVNPMEDKVAHRSGDILEMGAAPEAHIVAVRVAPEMVSLSTANLAYGIDYASRRQKCDVISMSHGGSASQMWADSVNSAYDRGTAIFAATGDYFPFPWVPLHTHRLGIIVPSSTVYPAAFRRVVGVAGVNHNHHPYGATDWRRHFTGMFTSLDSFTGSFMRGSYGADGVRRSLFSAWKHAEMEKTDRSQVRRYNLLRANPISASAPGVPWAVVSDPKKPGAKKLLDLDGGGTSSATPQAAAAAALWLQKNRPAIIRAGEWNTWKKAEAAYTAMFYTADRSRWNQDISNKADQQPDPLLGAGELKAHDMLKMTYADAKKVKGQTLAFPHDGKDRFGEDFKDAKNGMPKDYYDGERSFLRMLSGPSRNEVRGKYRAELQETQYSRESDWMNALTQMMHNRRLIELWQVGQTPVKKSFFESDEGRNGFVRIRLLFGRSGLMESSVHTWAQRKAQELDSGRRQTAPAFVLPRR